MASSATWLALADHLFAPPVRWGWRISEPAAPPPAPVSSPALGPRPQWVEQPPLDTGALTAARAKAVTGLVWRIAFAVVLVFAAGTFYGLAQQRLDEVGQEQEDAQQVTELLPVVALVAGGLLAISVLRALGRVRSASAALHRFEGPYKAQRAAERDRYERAVAEWDGARRAHEAAVARAKGWSPAAAGLQWHPVHPASDPMRIDVVGGDYRRHGWAGLLVTLGTSVMSGRHRVTVLDLTDLDVGGGLVEVAQARGVPCRRVDLPGDTARVRILEGLSDAEVAECLAAAVTGRREQADVRQERAFVRDLLALVMGCLEGERRLGQIAAGVDLLRQAPAPDVLSADEVSRLADRVGELGSDEWTARQMRFVASQLRVLDDVTAEDPGLAGGQPLWGPEALSVITTAGLEDRKELLDRMVVQLAQVELRPRRSAGPHGRLDGVLVVAGADHLGAAALDALSDRAVAADVRLMLMIDQPQGDTEKVIGTGGAVCIMKMYNHRDAMVAAEFVGRGHKFVLSGVTYQTGKSFTDGAGDSFSANTGQGSSTKGRRGGELSESRGQAWANTRSWSVADNISDSQTMTRVHEFTVEPQEILGMPETAFILVDNSGQGRRVVMADSNPGIALMPGVSKAL